MSIEFRAKERFWVWLERFARRKAISLACKRVGKLPTQVKEEIYQAGLRKISRDIQKYSPNRGK